MIFPYLMSNWSCVEHFKIFQKCDSYGPDELFVGRAIRNWVFYLDIQKQTLYFKPLVNTLAQILMEVWHFQDLTYFWISRPSYLTFDYKIIWLLAGDCRLAKIPWCFVKSKRYLGMAKYIPRSTIVFDYLPMTQECSYIRDAHICFYAIPSKLTGVTVILKNWRIFVTLWPSYLTFDLQKK